MSAGEMHGSGDKASCRTHGVGGTLSFVEPARKRPAPEQPSTDEHPFVRAVLETLETLTPEDEAVLAREAELDRRFGADVDAELRDRAAGKLPAA